MTLEQILALLMAKFSGVRKDGLEQLAKAIRLNATTTEEAQALVDKYTSEQVTEFVNDWRKDVDKEVGNGVKTAETNFKKKYNITDEPNPADTPTPKDEVKDPADIASLIKSAVADAVKPFQEKLNVFETGNLENTRKEALNGKLANAPEEFKNRVLRDYGRMKFDTDEAFTEFLTDTEKDLTDYTQEASNQSLSAFGRPVKASTESANEVSSGAAAYIAEKAGTEGDSGLGGKAV
jgi:hypothetical protein